MAEGNVVDSSLEFFRNIFSVGVASGRRKAGKAVPECVICESSVSSTAVCRASDGRTGWSCNVVYWVVESTLQCRCVNFLHILKDSRTTLHSLGIVCFLVKDMGFIEREVFVGILYLPGETRGVEPRFLPHDYAHSHGL